MALKQNELLRSVTTSAYPRVKADKARAKTVAAITGGPTLPVLTPMAFNTSTNKWVPWTNGGLNGTGSIKGFLYPTELVTDATDDVLGVIMIAGEVHHDDVPVPTGETQNNLTAALKAGLAAQGLYVTGIDGAY